MFLCGAAQLIHFIETTAWLSAGGAVFVKGKMCQKKTFDRGRDVLSYEIRFYRNKKSS